MSLQFDSKLWFLLSFQLRIPPWKIMTWSVDYDQNSWRNSFELDLDSGTGLGFRDRFRIRGRFACRDRFKGFRENKFWNRIMVPKTFSAEDSTLKNRYSKHSFENHRQIRLYSECFSGFWLRLQILVLRQSYYLNIFYKHSSKSHIRVNKRSFEVNLPEHVVSRYYIV